MKDKQINTNYYNSKVCETYNKILDGQLKTFSPHYFASDNKFKKISILIRYYVEERLKLTPNEAIDTLTLEMLQRDKLKCILKYLEAEKPIEYKTDKNYVAHIIYFAYPEIQKPSNHDLTVQCYKEVLLGKRKNFPNNYFKTSLGEIRAKECFDYLWKHILKIQYNDIPKVFLKSNEEGLNILKKYKLKILIQILYYSVSDMIKNMYPDLSLETICYKNAN